MLVSGHQAWLNVKLLYLLKVFVLSHISMNRGNGFTLNQVWYPVTSILTNQKQDQAERVLNSAHQAWLVCNKLWDKR